MTSGNDNEILQNHFLQSHIEPSDGVIDINHWIGNFLQSGSQFTDIVAHNQIKNLPSEGERDLENAQSLLPFCNMPNYYQHHSLRSTIFSKSNHHVGLISWTDKNLIVHSILPVCKEHPIPTREVMRWWAGINFHFYITWLYYMSWISFKNHMIQMKREFMTLLKQSFIEQHNT